MKPLPLPPPAIASDARCELGENPLWDPDQKCVYWTDISAGKILRLDWTTGACAVIYQGPPVGGFTLQGSGDLLLFRVRDVALLRNGGHFSVLFPFSDPGMSRFNDVIADPSGRVFAGTIGKTDQSGGLFRFDTDGKARKLYDGTGCSNGMGFSPDLSKFYWTCTTTRRLFQFDYNRSSGEISNRRLFYQATEDEGLPDGLAVDAEGCVWSARWNGGRIVRHSPSGGVLGFAPFPAGKISSLCFAGEKLDQIFATSARDAAEKNDTISGALFRTASPVRGMEKFRSNVVISPQ